MNQPTQPRPGKLYQFVKPVRDPARRQFVKKLACIGCGRTWGIDPMHTGPHGIGQKSCDFSTLPGCRRCHELFDADPIGFARARGFTVAGELRRINALYRKHLTRKAA